MCSFTSCFVKERIYQLCWDILLFERMVMLKSLTIYTISFMRLSILGGEAQGFRSKKDMRNFMVPKAIGKYVQFFHNT